MSGRIPGFRLDAGLLVDADQHGAGRRVQVEAADLPGPCPEAGVISAVQPAPRFVRADVRVSQDPPDGARRDLQSALAQLGKSGVPHSTVHLVGMRASQINGCGVCLDGAWRFQRMAGETDERLFALAGWREAPYYSDAERAALALAEAVTRLADHPDPVPDEIWAEAARHFDEPALAGLVLAIANQNLWNRLNVATRQVAGEWKPDAAGEWKPDA
jgi:AhpD family alkylhydroperoxidase